MNLLDSWVFVIWLVFADGEANMLTATNTLVIFKRIKTEEDCQHWVEKGYFPTIIEPMLETESVVDWGYKCFKAQDAGTKL